jgi:hypothetical protein
MKNTQVARLLAQVTGTVNQQLLLQNKMPHPGQQDLRSNVPPRTYLARFSTEIRSLLSTTRQAIGHARRDPRHPTEEWIVQMARDVVDDLDGALLRTHPASHDRDTKLCNAFRTMVQSSGVQQILLPPSSPNLNALAVRSVRSTKPDRLAKSTLFGASLRRRAAGCTKHSRHERNHQGKENRLFFPVSGSLPPCPKI